MVRQRQSKLRSAAWYALQVFTLAVAYAVLIVIGVVYSTRGRFGLNVLYQKAMAFPAQAIQGREPVPSWFVRALSKEGGPLQSAAPDWAEVEEGFETGELSVTQDGEEVSRILLLRVNPNRFAFEVHTEPTGSLTPAEWFDKLKPAAIVNGSYFDPAGKPATPLVSFGKLQGPEEYEARHGAFVTGREMTGIEDLAGTSWKSRLQDAEHAMVSYPMLVGENVMSRMNADDRLLGNRTFVGQDDRGRIIFGTTTTGFFSLRRLAQFLPTLDLQIIRAVNLDGGPAACQLIKAKGHTRDFCGDWVTEVDGDSVELHRDSLPNQRWGLPIVVAIRRRGDSATSDAARAVGQ